MDRETHEVASRPEVSIVGELNPDIIFYGVPREIPEERELLSSGFTLTLGSSSAIMAHNLSLLGTKVSFASCIGSDAFGEMCCDSLREAGVDLSQVVQAPAGVNTGVTLILPLENTRRSVTYPGAIFELGIEHLSLDQLASAQHFHLSSLFLHRKLSPQLPMLFAEMRSRGLTTSLDTNDDPEEKWGGVLDEVIGLTDLLFCTEQELGKIARDTDIDAAASRLSGKVSLLVVKRGARGATAYADGRQVHVDALRVRVTDAVGAGDSFDAGFLHQWIRKASIETCLAYGNLAGALSVTRPGGTEAFKDIVHRSEFFAQHWNEGRLVRLSRPPTS